MERPATLDDLMLCMSPEIRAYISALEKDAARWQPIETADSNTLALLYAPPEALFAEPAKHLGEFRVAAPRNWTWATHWMPLPAPPVDAAIAASDPQKVGA